MSITDKTRKILWARSGNMCALCRRLLIEDATHHDSESVVAEEAHILGEKPGAARHDTSISEAECNGYGNLILLCRVHHKMVDDQPNTWPAARLREVKKSHERWVKDTLAENTPNLVRVTRITTGREIANLLIGSQASDFTHADVSRPQIRKFAAFFDNLKDWAEIISDLSPHEQTEASETFHDQLEQIEADGFWLLGGMGKAVMYGHKLRVAVLRIEHAPTVGV